MGINQVAIGQIQPVKKEVAEKIVEATSEKVCLNQNEKITIALSGLAALGAAVLLVKKGKANAAKNAVKNSVDDIAKAAQQQVKNGASVSSVKKEATKNLSHEGKKVVKEHLADALTEKRNAEKLLRQDMIKNSSAVNTSVSTTKGLNQGLKNVTDEKVVIDKMDKAAKAAKESADALIEQKKLVDVNPTHKNKKLLRYLENQNTAAQNQSLHVQEQGAKKIEQIRAEAQKKADNIAKMKASPNYAAGQEIMKQNAEKTASNSIKRKAARDINKPGYQRALAKFKGYSPEKLQGVVSSSKSSPVEKLVAGDLLANLK